MSRFGLKKSKGFTLAEVVTTVAIIGGLSAIAVPNYMRVKMNTNMEMVRQHVKVIGEALTEYHTKYGRFPAKSGWGQGTTDEELSITASLSAIDFMGYTTDRYYTYGGRSNYMFRTDPKAGQVGISGDRCLVVDTLRSQGEWINCGSAEGISMELMSALMANVFNFSEKNPSFSFFLNQITDINNIPTWLQQYFNNTLEYWAYNLMAFRNALLKCSIYCSDSPSSTIPSMALAFTNHALADGSWKIDAYQKLFNNAREALTLKGVFISQNDMTSNVQSLLAQAPNNAIRGLTMGAINENGGGNASVFQVGLEVRSEGPLSQEQLRAKMTAVSQNFMSWSLGFEED